MIITAPQPPTIINVEIRDGTSVEVTWQQPPNTNGIIQGYQVLYFGYEGMLPENNAKQETVKPLFQRRIISYIILPLSV